MTRQGFADQSRTVLIDELGDAAAAKPAVREEARVVVLSLLPWGISILFHAALVLLAFFIIWAVLVDRHEEQLLVPSLAMTDARTSPLVVEAQERQLETTSRSRASARPLTPSTHTATIQQVMLTPRLIGMQGSPDSAAVFGNHLEGNDSGVRFIGQPDRASSIVFVVDASGSLLDTFPFVVLELQKSIRDLTDKQSFTIIFFQGEQAIEVSVPHRGLKTADAKTLEDVARWLDPSSGNITARGGTNPMPAIRLGLSYRPQVMYLLSDNITGGGTGATTFEIEQGRLLDEVRRANVSNTRINAIQFLYPDPLASIPGRRGTLEQIAESNGGAYKFVDADELNLGR